MARFRIAAARSHSGTPAANDGQFDDAEGDVDQEVAQVCDNRASRQRHWPGPGLWPDA